MVGLQEKREEFEAVRIFFGKGWKGSQSHIFTIFAETFLMGSPLLEIEAKFRILFFLLKKINKQCWILWKNRMSKKFNFF